MPQPPSGEEFDWVTAQSTCTAETMFRRLLTGAGKDVEQRNALSGRSEGWTFELHEEDDRFEITRSTSSSFGSVKVLAAVTFERDSRRIEIHGEDVDVHITAIVVLDAQGHCRFVVGEAEYAEWEIRRMALEQLFFEEVAD